MFKFNKFTSNFPAQRDLVSQKFIHWPFDTTKSIAKKTCFESFDRQMGFTRLEAASKGWPELHPLFNVVHSVPDRKCKRWKGKRVKKKCLESEKVKENPEWDWPNQRRWPTAGSAYTLRMKTAESAWCSHVATLSQMKIQNLYPLNGWFRSFTLTHRALRWLDWAYKFSYHITQPETVHRAWVQQRGHRKWTWKQVQDSCGIMLTWKFQYFGIYLCPSYKAQPEAVYHRRCGNSTYSKIVCRFFFFLQ